MVLVVLAVGPRESAMRTGKKERGTLWGKEELFLLLKAYNSVFYDFKYKAKAFVSKKRKKEKHSLRVFSLGTSFFLMEWYLSPPSGPHAHIKLTYW